MRNLPLHPAPCGPAARRLHGSHRLLGACLAVLAAACSSAPEDDPLAQSQSALCTAHPLTIKGIGTGTGMVIEGSASYKLPCTQDRCGGTFQAIPDPLNGFVGWTDTTCKAASRGTDTCTVSLTAPLEIAAEFSAPLSLQVTLLGRGKGNVILKQPDADPQECGTSTSTTDCALKLGYKGAQLTAMPAAPGHRFVGWGDACRMSGVTPLCDLPAGITTVNVTAVFATPCSSGELRECPRDDCQMANSLVRAVFRQTCNSDGETWGDCSARDPAHPELPSTSLHQTFGVLDPTFSHDSACGSANAGVWHVPAGAPNGCGALLGPYRPLPEGYWTITHTGYAYGDAKIELDIRDAKTKTIVGSSGMLSVTGGFPFSRSIRTYSNPGCHPMEYRLRYRGGGAVDLHSIDFRRDLP